jgi:hypothetical protein
MFLRIRRSQKHARIMDFRIKCRTFRADEMALQDSPVGRGVEALNLLILWAEAGFGSVLSRFWVKVNRFYSDIYAVGKKNQKTP